MKYLSLIPLCGMLLGCVSETREVKQPTVVEPAGAAPDIGWAEQARDKNQRPYGHQWEKKSPADVTPTFPNPP